MNTNRIDTWVNYVNYTVIGLVVALAGMSFIISFSTLYELARHFGVGEYLSYMWPFLLDFAMIVFSLNILLSALKEEDTKLDWALVILFTAISIIANIAEVWLQGTACEAILTNLVAGANDTSNIPTACQNTSTYILVIGIAVKALAPIALFLSFERLMQRLRADFKHSKVVSSITKVQAELGKLQSEHSKAQNELDNHLRQVKQNRVREIEAEVEAYKGQLYQQIADRQAQRDTLEVQIEQATEQFNSINEQIEVQTKLLNELEKKVSICQNDTKTNTFSARNAATTQRAERVHLTQMNLEKGATIQEIADKLDLSVSTIKRYVKEIKDQEEKEEKVSIPLNNEQYNDTFDTSNTHLMTSTNGVEAH